MAVEGEKKQADSGATGAFTDVVACRAHRSGAYVAMIVTPLFAMSFSLPTSSAPDDAASLILRLLHASRHITTPPVCVDVGALHARTGVTRTGILSVAFTRYVARRAVVMLRVVGERRKDGY